MDHAQNDALDSATLRSWYDDFANRWQAYTQVLGRLCELRALQLTPNEFDEQEQFVARLVEQMFAKYDRKRLRELCDWVQEQRQQMGLPAPRLNGVVEPTALQLALWWFDFVGGVWERTKKLGLSGNPALSHFNDCLNYRRPPAGNELHALLSEEHTLARRALKAMAVKPLDPASVEPSRQQKLETRDKQIKLLCKTHKLKGQWVRLADVANDDPSIKQLGLKPITKHIARNVMIPPQRRLKK